MNSAAEHCPPLSLSLSLRLTSWLKEEPGTDLRAPAPLKAALRWRAVLAQRRAVGEIALSLWVDEDQSLPRFVQPHKNVVESKEEEKRRKKRKKWGHCSLFQALSRLPVCALAAISWKIQILSKFFLIKTCRRHHLQRMRNGCSNYYINDYNKKSQTACKP